VAELLHTLHCTASQSGNTSFIRPEWWSPNRSDVSFVYCRISWCHAAASSSVMGAQRNSDEVKQRLLNLRHRMEHSAFIMQLMNGVSIFTHVCGQTVYALAAIELLNSIDSCETWHFRFCGLWLVLSCYMRACLELVLFLVTSVCLSVCVWVCTSVRRKSRKLRNWWNMQYEERS